MDGPVRRVRVLGDSGYDVAVGSGALGELAAAMDRFAGARTALVISETVRRLHGERLLHLSGEWDRHVFIMPDGEEHKSLDFAKGAFEWMLREGLTRKSVVIGVGGGVVGDFSGFLAALFMRGLPVIHVPTTLLAMVDSSVGGKVAVNISAGKNIVGVFHQPAFVAADISLLATLPDLELKNGLTEAVKHALIGDEPLRALFDRTRAADMRVPEVLDEIVYHSVRFKGSIVERDEREEGIRAILNFGHTVGHALESLSGYRGITHGQAVALGMKAEILVSRRLGMLREDDCARALGLIDKFGLAETRVSFGADEIVRHMRYDKKNSGGSIRPVLLAGPGKPVFDIPVEEGILAHTLGALFG
ncbi:MAG: 3-dehydroquinate synthase [Spirochaetes bacterium]|nr:MAG: 3-dehydroquinate synthase [Spirochaetota bacterium]